MTAHMNVRTLALVAATCLGATACGGPGGIYGPPTPTTTPPPAVVDQTNATAALAFDPETLTTKVGYTVTFAFGSSMDAMPSNTGE